jgi:hypothetical protein
MLPFSLPDSLDIVPESLGKCGLLKNQQVWRIMLIFPHEKKYERSSVLPVIRSLERP